MREPITVQYVTCHVAIGSCMMADISEEGPKVTPVYLERYQISFIILTFIILAAEHPVSNVDVPQEETEEH